MSKLQPLARTALEIGSEAFTLETLRSHQWDLLSKALAYAKKNSRFYKSHLPEERNLQINGPSDLACMPFTEPRHIECDINKFLCVPPHEIDRIVSLSTSGSTGQPKRIGFSRRDLESTTDFFEYGMQELVSKGKRVMICFPGTAENCMVELLSKGISRFGGEPLVYGAIRDAADAAEYMLAYKPHSIVAVPVQLFGLASYIDARSLRGKTSLETALLSSDHLADSIRSKVESVFGCEVYNHYGSTEMGYGAALECPAHYGMHLREADIFFEIIDPQTGEPMTVGEHGEIVFTTLSRKGMPLIRYRTGDYASFLEQSCSCGSILPKLSPPFRKNGCEICLEAGILDIKSMDEALFSMDGLIDYEVFISRANGKNKVLRIVIWRDYGHLDDSAVCKNAVQAVRSLPPLGGSDIVSAEIAKPNSDSPCLRGKRLFRNHNQRK